MSEYAETETLVRRCAAGEDTAWEEFVQRFTPLILGVLRQYRFRWHEQEDVVQATWVRVLRYLYRLNEPERIAGWLVVITRNEALKYLKRHGQLVPVGGLADFEWFTPVDSDVEEHAISRMDAQRVASALSKLPLDDQRLLALLMAEPPYSYNQVSRIMRIPRGSVGPTRRRCLERLKSEIEKRPDAEPGVGHAVKSGPN